MMLAALMLIPLLGALVVTTLPAARARGAALWTTCAALAMTVVAATLGFNWSLGGTMQLESTYRWIPTLGLSLSFGVDSVAMLLIILTAILGPLCVLCSWTAITERVKTFFAWLLVLQAAMVGVFAARDLIFFYICFEFTLIPMYFLIALYGSTNRRKAATKFFLYTFTGSIIALAGLVYVAWYNAAVPVGGTLWAGAGTWTFDIATLELAARSMPMQAQLLVMIALLSGFAVKVPLFPVHTWLPLAHTEAPTAGSVILAGVLLKLGTYALYRFVLPFVPGAVAQYAPILAVLCVIGILYGGLICWVQTDVKKLVAYSSVAHLGFCVLGLLALNPAGIKGSILYMINHGLSTGALFLCIGMMYERYHTRSMREVGGLAARMPIWATFMVFFTMASVGLPGLNGFVSEFLCLLGAFQADSAWGHGVWGSTLGDRPLPGATPGNLGPSLALLSGVGMIIAAMYLLIMLGKVVWGPYHAPAGHDHHAAGASEHGAHGSAQPATAASHAHLPPDLTTREWGLLLPLAALCIALGVYPSPLLSVLQDPVARTVAVIDQARQRTLGDPVRPSRPTPPESLVTPAASSSVAPESPAASAARSEEPHQ